MGLEELEKYVVTTLRDDATFKTLTGSTWTGAAGDPRIYQAHPPDDEFGTLDDKAAYCVIRFDNSDRLPVDAARPDQTPDHYYIISIFSKTRSTCWSIVTTLDRLFDEKKLDTTSYYVLWSRRDSLTDDMFETNTGRVWGFHYILKMSWIVEK